MSRTRIYKLPLANGGYALIDAHDRRLVDGFRWFALDNDPAGRRIYAYRTERINGVCRWIYLHREIASAAPFEVIDHINGDGLDCRRKNLRSVDSSQNAANARGRGGSSKFKGVCLDKQTGRWRATLTLRRQQIRIGRFAVEEDAARAYDAAAIEAWGDHACLNFPPQGWANPTSAVFELA